MVINGPATISGGYVNFVDGASFRKNVDLIGGKWSLDARDGTYTVTVKVETTDGVTLGWQGSVTVPVAAALTTTFEPVLRTFSIVDGDGAPVDDEKIIDLYCSVGAYTCNLKSGFVGSLERRPRRDVAQSRVLRWWVGGGLSRCRRVRLAKRA